MPTASIIILHRAAATSIQEALCSNDVEATRQRVLSFIEQNNAAEQAARVAAAKASSLKNVNCNCVKIGAYLFPSGSNEPNLICCQADGCHNEQLHHACQAEWEIGRAGRKTGGCEKY